jgi:hypothetical protein
VRVLDRDEPFLFVSVQHPNEPVVGVVLHDSGTHIGLDDLVCIPVWHDYFVVQEVSRLQLIAQPLTVMLGDVVVPARL